MAKRKILSPYEKAAQWIREVGLKRSEPEHIDPEYLEALRLRQKARALRDARMSPEARRALVVSQAENYRLRIEVAKSEAIRAGNKEGAAQGNKSQRPNLEAEQARLRKDAASYRRRHSDRRVSDRELAGHLGVGRSRLDRLGIIGSKKTPK